MIRTLASFCILALAPSLCWGGEVPQATGGELYGSRWLSEISIEVARQLDERNVNLAIVARSGRKRSDLPAGIQFTHIGVAIFEPILRKDGKIRYGYAVYQLYQGANGDPTRSFLKQDYLYDLAAGAAEPEIGILVPVPQLQKRIARVIRSQERLETLYSGKFNLLANPHDADYDNCTSFVLKLIFSALYETDDLTRLETNLKAYFAPQKVELSTAQRIGLKFKKGIHTRDAPQSGPQTATFGRIEDFLEKYNLLKESWIVRIQP